MTFASSGKSTISHPAGELFKAMADVIMVHVLYRGGRPTRIDLIACQVQLDVANMLSALPLAKTGKLRRALSSCKSIATSLYFCSGRIYARVSLLMGVSRQTARLSNSSILCVRTSRAGRNRFVRGAFKSSADCEQEIAQCVCRRCRCRDT